MFITLTVLMGILFDEFFSSHLTFNLNLSDLRDCLRDLMTPLQVPFVFFCSYYCVAS